MHYSTTGITCNTTTMYWWYEQISGESCVLRLVFNVSVQKCRNVESKSPRVNKANGTLRKKQQQLLSQTLIPFKRLSTRMILKEKVRRQKQQRTHTTQPLLHSSH